MGWLPHYVSGFVKGGNKNSNTTVDSIRTCARVDRVYAPVEHQVVCNRVATTEAVVKVHSSAGAVEKRVEGNRCLHCLCLEIRRALLLPQPNLPNDVVGDGGEAWKVAGRAIIAPSAVCRELVCGPPRCNRSVTNPLE